jgi:hypothetical protein
MFHCKRRKSFFVELQRKCMALSIEEGVTRIFFKFRFKKKIERNPVKEVFVFVGIIVLLLALFMGTVRYIVVKSSPLRTKVDKKLSNLHFSLRMNNAVYQRSEPIILKLEVTNIGTRDVVLDFPSSLECDFVVERELDLFFVKIPFTVWKYSAQVGDIAEPHKVKLDPGQSKLFIAKWNQTDVGGKQVVPGKYRITSIMNTKNLKVILTLRGETEK